MKKIYVKPALNIQQVNMQQLMAGSPTPTLWEEPADKTKEVLGRRSNSIWDDEEDEDF